MQNSTLSVIVPAYNESEYISNCIEALLTQGDYVDEIIIVDNNSSDGTAEMVEEYRKKSPRVHYLSETRRGVVYARNTGFDAASGDIIGRIDADTIVGPAWASAVHEFFARDEDFSGVTGLMYLYESPIAGIQRRLTNWRLRRRRGGAVRPVVAVPGSNMAMRRSAWLAVRDSVSERTDIHEDIDLSLCIARSEFGMGQIADMAVKVSGRRGMSSPRVYSRYNKASKNTLEHHGISSVRLDVLIFLDGILHTLLWPLYRMYDSKAGRLSAARFTQRHHSRELPVTEDVRAV